MVDSGAPVPACREHPLWAALESYSIGPDGAAMGFTARLAAENGWSTDHARRVIGEYRRFVFLAVTQAEPMTPSDAVDQAWHLHLTDTRDYWERFCPQVVGRALHHVPSRGGPAERSRFFAQYARTLKAYADTFGEDAPEDIWPAAGRRLIDDPRARRVHPRDGLVIGRGRLLAQMLGVAALSCALLEVIR